MDVTLLTSAVFDIPSSRRVGAIVHDGTTDLRLWPGPGWDRELGSQYGDGLQRALDAERAALPGKELPIGEVVRVHPGRLHCDMLVWAATRPPEPGTARNPAPDAELLERTVDAVLAFVATRDVERVAFPALGVGPGELPVHERLAIIVRASHAYADRCFAAGRAPVVEEVLVCERSATAVSQARQKVRNLASSAAPEPVRAAASSEPERRRRSAGGSRAATRPKRGVLDRDEVAQQRATSDPYDRSRVYGVGQWMVHPKFGAGRVELVTQEGHIEVLFEDGQRRKMLHNR
jgi:O-acetyl-ADP-ribose deacetylase (regulator of RNase III)